MAGSDCKSTREILDLYLDNELLVETSHSVVQHLSSCPDCAAESERRIELGRLLRATSTLDDDYAHQTENHLRKRIEAAFKKDERRRIAVNFGWAVLAASLIVVLGVGYWRFTAVPKQAASSTVNTPKLTPDVLLASMDRDAVANHQACALTYPPTWTYDRQRVVRELTPRFASLVDVVGRSHGAYALIEGHVCSYQERQYAHLIFRGNSHTASVFIQNDEPAGKPESSPPSEIGQASYTAYQVASVDTGIHRIYLVSDLPSTENVALAKQLFPPTLSFIQKLEHSGV